MITEVVASERLLCLTARIHSASNVFHIFLFTKHILWTAPLNLCPVVPTREKKWHGVDATPYCSSGSFNSASPIMSEMTSTLSALDIQIEQIHYESGGGQFETTVGHFPCLLAAGNLLLLRETVTAIADKHKLCATFLHE